MNARDELAAAVAELGALPMPTGEPMPVELTEKQIETLAAAGNRAVNDHYHEDLCYCRSWPTSCESSGQYFMGTWDTYAFNIGLPAVLGVWESLRNDRHAAKIAELRARVAELEAGSPWERAVAGLNALVDAGVAFHVEPDGHISAPFSDEHIEWDLKSRRWVLTHDDEDEGLPPLPGELAEQRHLVDPLDHVLEHFADEPQTEVINLDAQIGALHAAFREDAS
ncbi:hypothetical protein AB0G71_12550 [Streptomyces sp. NPDC020403]|uniref:hypothetical protein n=1 Tax=unclassified Streptomyces TaxID=2593676 RepID=UPI0033F72765